MSGRERVGTGIFLNLEVPRSLLACLLTLGALLAPLALAGGAWAAPAPITEFAIPTASSSPWAIAPGPDGNLWFTEESGNKIGRITPSGQITEYPVPTEGSDPHGITAGPDGSMWFTEGLANKIGQITPSGRITEFPIPGVEAGPAEIAAGPDGNLWFTEGNRIGRITPSGQITSFPLATEGSTNGITAGPDGNLWFTHDGPVDKELVRKESWIGRITPNGQITEFPVPSENALVGITAGPGGSLWFTNGHNIGRITPSGQISEFAVPGGSYSLRIALGPDGNLWFTGGNSIGRITPSGQITEFPVPTNNSIPEGIAAGPDGNLWFTETSNVGNKIGRITPGVPGVQIGNTRALVSHDMLTLELACAGGSAGTACRGALRLRIRVNRRFHRRRLTNSKALAIARGRYSLPSEHSGRIVLRLGRHALILLTRHHRLRVSATATVSGGQGASREVILQRLAHRNRRQWGHVR